MVGKYVALHDAYLSVAEALKHGGIANRAQVNIRWIDAEELTPENLEEYLHDVDGILVTGGFGQRGTMASMVKLASSRARSARNGMSCRFRLYRYSLLLLSTYPLWVSSIRKDFACSTR